MSHFVLPLTFEALCSWGINQLSARPGTEAKFITKSRSLELLPNRIASAETKAWICTADDCFNVEPQLHKTFCWLLYFYLSPVRICLILLKMLFGFCRSSSFFFQLMSNLPSISFRNGSGGSGTSTLNGGYFTA